MTAAANSGRGTGAFGGALREEVVVIQCLDRAPRAQAKTVAIKGTQACWWHVSPARQHWLVRVPGDHGHVEMASILVEMDGDGQVILVGGDRLGQGVHLAETIALGRETRTPVGEQLLLVACTILAFAGPLHTDAPAREAAE